METVRDEGLPRGAMQLKIARFMRKPAPRLSQAKGETRVLGCSPQPCSVWQHPEMEQNCCFGTWWGGSSGPGWLQPEAGKNRAARGAPWTPRRPGTGVPVPSGGHWGVGGGTRGMPVDDRGGDSPT